LFAIQSMRNFFLFVIVALFTTTSFSQQKFTLSGTISEASSNETLIGVTVAVPGMRTGTTTNEYGFYSITLPKGQYEIIISYLGFKNIRETITLDSNRKRDFQMNEEAEQLDEVILTDDSEKLEIRKPQMSVNTLAVQTIKQIPVVLGEADVIKSIVLLPGVTNAGEASSGFNVRGGAVDQNLILLDEATIFNSSHLFGFFSVFNPDAIKDVKLFKGGIYLSGYFGRDLFSIQNSFINVYGNAVGNFRWNHLFSDKLFSNLSLIYSDYFYGLELDFVGFEWDSGIQNFNLKYDLKHYLSDKLQINYGLNNTYYVFNPGKIIPSSAESGIVEEQLTKKYANENAVYIDVEHELSDWLSVEYGLRASQFNRLGQDEFFIYENNNPVAFDPFSLTYQEATPIDTINPGRGGSLEKFFNLEPRISAAATLNDNTSLKASYTRLAQYLHLLSNTSSPTPLDVWTPSGPFVKPQLLDQYAFGFFKNINEGAYSLEIETFYKDIQNRIDYIDGANLIANNAIEQVILNGQARAYGLEFLVRKNEGQFTGWLAYTLSRSEQRTPGRILNFDTGRSNMETGINFGDWYPTPFDKTHDVALFGNFKLNENWSFNSNFIYQTGQPTNFPVGQFEFQELVVPVFGLRNQQRLPDYHRLDIGATFTPKKNKDRTWQGEWVFSIYNIYNRMNAASINFRQNQDTGRSEAIRTSIFGIVPAITYNFSF